MQKNSEGINDFSIEKAMKLAQSDAGKQLFTLLQNTDGEKLQAAMSQAAAGDLEEVKKTMQQIMKSGQVQQLMNKMRGDENG